MAFRQAIGSGLTISASGQHIVNGATATNIGDLIVVAAEINTTSSTAWTITDSAGNTYVQVGNILNTNGVVLGLFYSLTTASIAATTGFINVAYTGTATVGHAVAAEFDGVYAGGVLDQKVSGTGTNASPASGSTPTVSRTNELVVVAAGTSSTPTYVLGTGYTNLVQVPGVALESKTLTNASGGQSGGFTGGASTNKWACMCATFLMQITTAISVSETLPGITEAPTRVLARVAAVNEVLAAITSTITQVFHDGRPAVDVLPALADLVARAFQDGRPTSDTITLSPEIVTAISGHHVSISDPLPVPADSLARSLAAAATAAASLTTSDSAVAGLTRPVSEIMPTPADGLALVQVLTRAVATLIPLADSDARLAVMNRILAEITALAGMAARGGVFARLVGENLPVLDVATAGFHSGGSAPAVSDVMVLTNDLAAQLNATRSVPETLVLASNVSAAQQLARNVAAALTVIDSAAASRAMARLTSQNLAIAEAVATTLNALRSDQAVLSTVAGAARAGVLARVLNDVLVTTQALMAAWHGSRAAQELFVQSDAAAASAADLRRNIQEAMSLSDSVVTSTAQDYVASASELLGITDVPAMNLALGRFMVTALVNVDWLRSQIGLMRPAAEMLAPLFDDVSIWTEPRVGAASISLGPYGGAGLVAVSYGLGLIELARYGSTEVELARYGLGALRLAPHATATLSLGE